MCFNRAVSLVAFGALASLAREHCQPDHTRAKIVGRLHEKGRHGVGKFRIEEDGLGNVDAPQITFGGAETDGRIAISRVPQPVPLA
jgi:hypothetical protein